MVALGQPTSTGIDVFTYDAPSVSGGPSPSNAPKKSGYTFTHLIAGADFSVYDLSGSADLGSSVCEGTFWSSDSAVTAANPSFGASPENMFGSIVSVGARSGTETISFSYDSPAISGPSVLANAPTTGSSTFGIFGIDFAICSGSPRTSVVQGSPVETTRWISDTSLYPRTSAGVSSTGLIVVTLANDMRTSSEIFSFEAPHLRREISTKLPFGGAGGLFKWMVCVLSLLELTTVNFRFG